MGSYEDNMFGRDFLDDTVNWITQNMEMNDVYEEKDILYYVTENMEPSLIEWAKDNGWVQSE